MPARSIRRGKTLVGHATPSNAPLYVDSDDNKLKMVPAGSGSTEVEVIDAATAQTITGVKTFTASPVIPAPVVTDAYEDLITTRVLVAADSGKVFSLSLAAGFTVTLPAPAAGLNFRFYVKIAPTTAVIVATNAGAQVMAGTVFSGAGADEDSEVAFTANALHFVANTAVINDSADFFSDGTNWYARGWCNATGGITLEG